MRITTMLPADLLRIKEVQPPSWDDITPFFDEYVNHPHCEALKGEVGGKLVAVGAIISHGDTAWLAHILVHEECRNQGLGGQITQALMNHSFAIIARTVMLIATDLGEPLYTRLGFCTDQYYSVFRYEMGQVLQPGNATSLPFLNIMTQDLLELDFSISGEYRENTLKPHMANARIIMDEFTMRGAYFPTLGDGLIIARDSAAGLALLNERLSTSNFAVIPEQNTTAIAYLEALGLFAEKRVPRMFTGQSHTWNPQGMFHRIGGNLG